MLPPPRTDADAQALHQSEPELVAETVALIQAEATVPEALRALALRSLAVQMADRTRSTLVVTAITSRASGGVLSVVLHKAIASLVEQDAAVAAAAAAADATSEGTGGSSSGAAGPSVAPPAAAPATPTYSADYVEAMLSLVQAMLTSTQGCTALADAGVVAALLPMLRIRAPEHMGLVSTTVKVLESFMDYSQSASTIFRDLDGLRLMIERLAHEAGVAPPPPPAAPPTEEPAAAAATSSGAPAAATEAAAPAAEAGSEPVEAAPPPAAPAPAPFAFRLSPLQAAAGPLPPVALPYQRKVLLKFLLRAIAISSYAPAGGNTARPQEVRALG